MACGREYTVTVTWDSGRGLKHMVMEFISGKMEIGMKEIGKTA